MTLVDKAQEDIKKIITDKTYDTDTGFLPSEAELSKALGVSRATTREAVKSLEVRGFVKRIHGKGILVVDRSDSVVAQALSDMYEQHDVSLSDILEVRTIIEVPSAGLAAIRATDEDIRKMEECVSIMRSGNRDDEAYVEADMRFHLTLVESTKNRTLVSLTKSYQSHLAELVRKSCSFLDVLESKSHVHENVLQAIKEHDPEKAKFFMREHLNVTKAVEQHIREEGHRPFFDSKDIASIV